MDKKKIGSILLSFIIGLSAVPLSGVPVLADEQKCGDNVTWDLTDGTLTISGTGAMYDYEDGTSPWYNKRSDITEVVIENGVGTIGNYSFEYCSNLSSVTIPVGVTSIGEYSFENCTSLTSVTIPNSVSTIKMYAFYGCQNLAVVNISENSSQLTSIGDQAFSSCSNLTKITIPSNVTYVGLETFYGCTGITDVYCYADPSALSWDDDGCDDFILPRRSRTTICHVKSGELSLYQGFSADVNVTFVDDIGKSGSCGEHLTWTLDDNNVLNISGYGAMYDFDFATIPWNDFRSSISAINIGDEVTTIGTYAFYVCSSIESIDIPANVTSIGSNAFYSCNSLETVIIPASVTYIGPDAFFGCSNVTAVYCYANPNNLVWEEDYCDDFLEVDDPADRVPCYVPPTYLNKYLSDFTDVNVNFCELSLAGGNCGAEGDNLTWTLDGDYKLTIEGSGAMKAFDSLSEVPWSSYNSRITEVVIGSGATSIEKYAFSGCSSLSSITIPNSVTSIGENVFSGCQSLATINIPSAVTTIGDYAFMGSAITSATIPAGVTIIEDNLFEGCRFLESVTISGNITAINLYAFKGCESLTSISLPGTVTQISVEAFIGCSGLTDIYCTADPDNLSWRSVDAEFMSNKATSFHVPGNYLSRYEDKFPTANVTFVGDLESIFSDGIGEHLEGYSLSLEGDIGVKFYMDLADSVVSDPDAKMVFSIPNDGTTETSEVKVSDASTITVKGRTYYVFKCNVSAKEMTSAITAQMVVGNKQGTEYTYSVREYAEYILSNPTVYPNEQELVKAMLNYGAYAQVYFGYNTGDLANDGYENDTAITAITASDLSKYAYNGPTDFNGITFTGVSLKLKSELVMTLRFRDVPDGTVFKLGAQELTAETSGRYTTVTLDKITAKNIDSTLPINIYNGDTLIGTVEYSPMTYCYNVIDRGVSSSRPQELIDLAKALYLYSYQADSYIPN